MRKITDEKMIENDFSRLTKGDRLLDIIDTALYVVRRFFRGTLGG